MAKHDSAKTFGLVGLILIITAFIMWGFVVPALRSSVAEDAINKTTEVPRQRQENPQRPTGESAIPPHE